MPHAHAHASARSRASPGRPGRAGRLSKQAGRTGGGAPGPTRRPAADGIAGHSPRGRRSPRPCLDLPRATSGLERASGVGDRQVGATLPRRAARCLAPAHRGPAAPACGAAGSARRARVWLAPPVPHDPCPGSAASTRRPQALTREGCPDKRAGFGGPARRDKR